MFFKKWGVAVVAVAFLVVAAIAVLVYGNRTEHYHELSLTGERKNIPLLSQKAKASGNYWAEYRMFKLARIHWEQGIERKIWEISRSGSIMAYYQENTKLCHKHGVHASWHNFDSFGNSIWQECYGKDGQLILDSNGVAIYETEYDRHGNMTQQKCYGEDGQLTLDSDGVAVWKFEHDSYGNLLRLECYGVDGQLVLSNSDFAIREWEFDSAGNMIQSRLYDTNGRLLQQFEGW